MNTLPPQRPHVLLCFDLEWNGSTEILKGISKHAEGRWKLTLDGKGQLPILSESFELPTVHGVITRHVTPSLIQRCQRGGIPLIDVNDSQKISGIAKVRPDNELVGRLGARHFLARGFHQFAFLGSNERWSRERATGYGDELERAGHRFVFLELPAGYTDLQASLQSHTNIGSWLRRQRRPLALMTCNDLYGLSAINACAVDGIPVPAEVSILSVNNDPTRCQLAHPALTSIDLDHTGLGIAAASLLEGMFTTHMTLDADIRIPPKEIVVRASTGEEGANDPLVHAAILYIKSHYQTGISVDNIMASVGVSRSSLEKRFRKALGISPNSMIRRTQVNSAMKLLEETDYPIRVISKMVGVDHPEYLVVLFARTMGISPGQYRRSIRVTSGDGSDRGRIRMPLAI